MKELIYKYFSNFSKNLKLERKSRHLTQKELASAIGVKTQSYQAYESGVAMPTVENLIKLTIFLNISLDELFEMNK